MGFSPSEISNAHGLKAQAKSADLTSQPAPRHKLVSPLSPSESNPSIASSGVHSLDGSRESPARESLVPGRAPSLPKTQTPGPGHSRRMSSKTRRPDRLQVLGGDRTRA